MDIRRPLGYAENARRLLRETLAAHPETLDHPWETAAAYGTIGQLVAHLVGAERRWAGCTPSRARRATKTKRQQHGTACSTTGTPSANAPSLLPPAPMPPLWPASSGPICRSGGRR